MTASIVSNPDVPTLPAPVARVGKISADTAIYYVPDGSASGATVGLQVRVTPVSVSTHGIAQEILDNPAWGLQLELLRYVRKRTSSNGWGRSFQNSGYVHPSNGPGPSGNGSHTHGGAHSKASTYVQSIRQTEWLAGMWGTEIDVTQGMLAFMEFASVDYRDVNGDGQNTLLPVPSGSMANRRMGKRFPYGGRFYPAYFKFRWSVIDPTDPRGQRITGPVGDTVSLTTDRFPFNPTQAFSLPGGQMLATCELAPGFEPRRLRAWIGSTSRLPR